MLIVPTRMVRRAEWYMLLLLLLTMTMTMAMILVANRTAG